MPWATFIYGSVLAGGGGYTLGGTLTNATAINNWNTSFYGATEAYPPPSPPPSPADDSGWGSMDLGGLTSPSPPHHYASPAALEARIGPGTFFTTNEYRNGEPQPESSGQLRWYGDRGILHMHVHVVHVDSFQSFSRIRAVQSQLWALQPARVPLDSGGARVAAVCNHKESYCRIWIPCHRKPDRVYHRTGLSTTARRSLLRIGRTWYQASTTRRCPTVAAPPPTAECQARRVGCSRLCQAFR